MLRLKTTAVALGAIMAIAACESSGQTRYASVGTVGPQGAPGPAGPQGEQGEAGPAGPAGPQGATGATGAQGAAGEDGGNFTLGDTGMIATGGLVGPDGIAGTGLLANLGDPDTTAPVAGDAMAQTGTILTAASDQVDGVLTEAGLPAELTDVTGAVTSTVANLGNALADTGTNGTPLVDGLTDAVAPLLTADIGAGNVSGGDSSDSLLGVSLLSTDQNSGMLGEVGVGSGASLINADFAPDADSGVDVAGIAALDLGPVTDTVSDVVDQTGLTDLANLDGLADADLSDLTQPVQDLLSGDGVDGLLGDSGLTDLVGLDGLTEGDLTDVTQPVEDLLSGDTPETPLDPIVGGLLGALGGGN